MGRLLVSIVSKQHVLMYVHVVVMLFYSILFYSAMRCGAMRCGAWLLL